ncbi:molybdopterin-dependent oxidoreductase [Shewanella intestini]|uniref:Molybdopterin-dependent oxidoreductase n=1 Tax=Shewanella intestini TaxID=2017544 RepID=A0ABS5HZI0_9GAMM|nr:MULTISPECIES: molybdopterin-dependent oxidoreductase [Shewanella]MBR9727181.1 molybdopterin-dependent oxidoreductase [Shewanella intestini]MRG35983.1 molybdopterin-dependent oxidoreductase [Shewanella sp. XMDDZSB0408]
MESVITSCAYCGVGCGVKVSTKACIDANTFAIHENTFPAKSATNLVVSGHSGHAANRGKLCAKGESLLQSLDQPSVLKYPLNSAAKPIDWQQAISTIAGKFSDTITQYGPDSVAFYLSGQLLTEDYYVANKLAKGFIKTANVDTNSRLCMSSAVSAHQRAFGEDVVAGCYDDFEQCDVIVLIGSNAAWTHPVLFQRMMKAREKRGTHIVVIDPATTATAQQADLHLAIKPGSDNVLFQSLLLHLVDNQLVDHQFIRAHTEDFDTVIAQTRENLALTSAYAVKQMTSPSKTDAKTGRIAQNSQHRTQATAHVNKVNNTTALSVQDITGLSAKQLALFFDLFSASTKVVTASCQGVNQSVSGTDTSNSIINCHLARGQVGQPGSGFFSLTGQPNAMGGREVGGLATQLSCHMGFGQQQQALLADFWQTTSVASKAGLSAVEMFKAVKQGKIKAIWIIGTNPAVSMPNSHEVNQALKACPFVVVSDVCADTDTAQYADLLLPALGWSQKDGTVTNSERMITRQRAFISTSGQAKADWWALAQVAKTMGFKGFDYQSSHQIFTEFAALSAKVKHTFNQQKFTISGLQKLTKAQYDNLAPTQWPIESSDDIGQYSTRVYQDHQFSFASGKARFVAANVDTHHQPVADAPDVLLLNSGRSRDQWHTMTRTGHIASLRASVAQPTVAIHPKTAKLIQLTEHDFIKCEINSQDILGGGYVARVVFDETILENTLNTSMHWSKQFSLTAGVNYATHYLVDNISKQPAFKHQLVRVSRYEVGLQGMWFGEVETNAELNGELRWKVQQTLKHGQCFHVAFACNSHDAQYSSQRQLNWSLHLPSSQQIQITCLANKDRITGIQILSQTVISADLEAMSQLISQPLNSALINQLHGLLKAGSSPLICVCTGVTEADIAAELTQLRSAIGQGSNGSDTDWQLVRVLENTQQKLGCGRQCGSCQSEVQRCVQQQWQLINNEPHSATAKRLLTTKEGVA